MASPRDVGNQLPCQTAFFCLLLVSAVVAAYRLDLLVSSYLCLLLGSDSDAKRDVWAKDSCSTAFLCSLYSNGPQTTVGFTAPSSLGSV